MIERLKVGSLTFLLILSLMLASHQPALTFNENSNAIVQGDHQPVQNVSFTLLAIEQHSNHVSLKSAQHLIETLMLFNNWKNGTVSSGFQYVSNIHLLSTLPFRDLDPECQPFYKGNVTRTLVLNEISTFLDGSLPKDNYTFSTQILYYAGESGKAVINGTTSYYMALDKPIYDWELNQLLQSSRSNSTNTLIVLDMSYSGGYISKLRHAGRDVLAACNPAETANRWISSQDSEPKGDGWFTGHEDAAFSNGTRFGPLGIIGGLLNAHDNNMDGWGSANEIFQFACETTRLYTANQTNPKTQAPYNQNPWASYGVAGGGIPVIQHDESTPFPGQAKECTPRPILSSSSRYDNSEFEHRMYRQSLCRSGFAPTRGPETPSLLWESSLDGAVTTSPAVAEGMVFVGTLAGKFYALDMFTSEIIWMFEADSPISSSPVVINGTVFFGTEEPGNVFALDSYTGLARWVYAVPNGAAVYSSPAIFDEKVFFGCSDRYLRCLSEFEGELLWTTYIGGEKLSSPAIADNMLFITSPYVYAVDVFTGRLLWKYVTSWAVFSAPAVTDGLVFIGSRNDDKVYALEQTSGELVWSFRSGGWFTSPAVDSVKNLVILGCRDARVYCLSEHTGSLQWEHIDGVNYQSAPTISVNGLVYLGSSNGNLYCLNEETGEEVWKHAVGATIVSSPSVIYEHVFVGSTDGRIHCFGSPFPTHNIAVSDAEVARFKVRMGELLEVTCTIENCGSVEENVLLSYGQNNSNVWTAPEYLEPAILHSENVTVAAGSGFYHVYSWDTSNEVPGLYSISIHAHLVPDETDASDNTYLVNAVMIVSPADVDANGKINIADLLITAKAYGSTPEDPDWNREADTNNDDIINVMDLFLIAKVFGEIYV